MKTKAEFTACGRSDKINLCVGAYRTAEGEPYHFECVRMAKERLVDSPSEYAPITGFPEYLERTSELYLGKKTHYRTMQTLSGTGALKLCAEFLGECYERHSIFLPNPTYANHRAIFESSGFDIKEYTYLVDGIEFDPNAIIESVAKIPPGSVVLFHACAHNPTGYDMNESEWREILDTCKKNNLMVVMDMAYLGFSTGDLYKDLTAIRILHELECPSFICTSFSKNLGLYGERIGNLFYYNDNLDATTSTLTRLARQSYSNPPINGAKIVCEILKDPELRASWQRSLNAIYDDYQSKRTILRSKLEAKMGGDFSDITQQRGMFYFSRVTSEQNRLFRSHGVFFPSNRISIAGLNDGNLERFVEIWEQTQNK